MSSKARRRNGRRGFVRAPAGIAAAIAAAIYGLLPDRLIIGPRFIIPALEIVLIAAVVLTNPRRSDRQSYWSRFFSLALIALIALVNLLSLILLIRELVSNSSGHGRLLLLAAGQVWSTNVIVFAAAYLGAGPRRTGRPDQEGSAPARPSRLPVHSR